ncbi:MAG TPA: hypothetical protein VKJ47_00965 [Candidatus Binatia bacterium]|nr:hypothetical protein [Candidatus Binatia bacterium]
MDRKKLGALLAAFIIGAILSAGSAFAQSPFSYRGYILGDSSHGKLVPFYRISPTLATIIGIEAEQHQPSPSQNGVTVIHGDIQVHVSIFTTRSTEIFDFDLCLSPWDFGFVVLQNGPESPEQIEELRGNPSQAAFNRQHKAKIVSLAELGAANNQGYVTLQVVQEFFSVDGTCSGNPFPLSFDEDFFEDTHIATWAILADVGNGFFATEIPTPTAVVDDFTGKVAGFERSATGEIIEASLGLIPGPAPAPDPTGECPAGFNGTPGCPLLLGTICTDTTTDPSTGLDECHTPLSDDVPRDLDFVVHQNVRWGGNEVIARYDVNPRLQSQTEIIVWLARNGFAITPDVSGIQRAVVVPAYLQCEDEKRISVQLPLPDEVNVICHDSFPTGDARNRCPLQTNAFGGLGECTSLNQFRGVLEFLMPDTGFLFSLITQLDLGHFRQTYLGYNLDNNGFIDCLDQVDDFGQSAEALCGSDVGGVSGPRS